MNTTKKWISDPHMLDRRCHVNDKTGICQETLKYIFGIDSE